MPSLGLEANSGVMGTEKNAQGAVPVALTFQQLGSTLDMGFHHSVYPPSLSLEPGAGVRLPKCEVDFVFVVPRPYPRRTAVILGECKDQGPVKLAEFERTSKICVRLPMRFRVIDSRRSYCYRSWRRSRKRRLMWHGPSMPSIDDELFFRQHAN
jgi:hypothetical protein